MTSFIAKKGVQYATKKFLNKQFEENKNRDPGGEWVSDFPLAFVTSTTERTTPY